ncbi:MAG: DNA-binding protein [Thermoplasmatota archaeon]
MNDSNDPELEELKRRKLEEMQQQGDQQAAYEEQQRKMEEQRAAILRKALTPKARERLGNVRVAYPDTAKMVEDQLISLVQSGRLDQEIDDQTLRQILQRVTPKKRDINIHRR